MAKPRVPAETQKLAYWFVSTILEQTFDYRFHGRHLKDAKRLINPDEQVVPLDPEKVKGCLLALRAGLFGFEGTIESMWCVTFNGQEGSYYEEFIKWTERPPAWYVPSEVKLWEMCTGLTAYPESPDIINHPELPLPISL
jgi:hypothetical protein